MSHWSEEIESTDLLERLLKVKELDGAGAEAIDDYVSAAGDEYASVRYWGVTGLRNCCKESGDVARTKEVVRSLLGDSSAAVRIAAAQTMCEWNEEEEALGVLADGLEHERESVRLFAIVALRSTGEKARAARESIIRAVQDTEYIHSAALQILRSFEK